ncbi:RNA polymerase sigma factor [Wocania ichthyoenteri]|uniref:RNA polymerase sigma factor n=1 Tax=Wocania ichthyoenteri TaxID=1230531 RepID=UPI00053DCC07|nr:RNA polymerase sigma-70 factor [Wocania ichthyoenteri]
MCKTNFFNEIFLVTEVANSNESAFLKLFNHYKNDVYNYSKKMLKEKVYAEEIVQDVFLKVWLTRENLNPDLSFKSYIFTITRNLTINFLHKAANDRRMRESVFYEKSTYYNSTDVLFDEIYCEKLQQQAINNLPPKRKRIFELSRKEDMSYDQISKELGISKNTVKNQMSRALDSIRDFLYTHSDITFLFLFSFFS